MGLMFLLGRPTELQIDHMIQIRPIYWAWIQTVCKGYQQTTKVKGILLGRQSCKENLTDSKVLPIFVGFSFKIIYFIWVFILFNFVNPDTILSRQNVPTLQDLCLSFCNVKLLLL